MLPFFILLLATCFSKGYPKTKALRGGVFTWPVSLGPSRKPWKWLKDKIHFVTLNFTDFSFETFAEQYLLDDINFNLNDEIRKMIDDINSGNFDDSLISKTKQFIIKKFSKSRSIKSSDSLCDPNRYPNINILLDGDSYGYDCQQVEDSIGQIFSYALIITPLMVISALALIFYLVFAFARCCCFKPETNSKPNTYELIAYICIATLLVFTIILDFSGSIRLDSAINYILKNKFIKDAEYVCKHVQPSFKNSMDDLSDVVINSIERLNTSFNHYIESNIQMLDDEITKTLNIADSFITSVQNLVNFGDKAVKGIQNSENQYEQCAAFQPSQTCPSSLSLLGDIHFDEAVQSLEELKVEIEDVKDSVNVSQYIDYTQEEINNFIEDAKTEIQESFNTSGIDPDPESYAESCNFSEVTSLFDDIPSFLCPLITAILVLLPIIMIIGVALQLLSFWYQNSFSRCCSFLCVPCGFCIIIQFVIGGFCTLVGILVIMYNLFYSHGDDMLDTAIKNITNQDRIIEFGTINLSVTTENLIGAFQIDNVKMDKIQLIKSFLTADVDTKLSKILDYKHLPIEKIANTIEKAMKSAVGSLNLDVKVLDPMKEEINDFIDEALPSDLSDITSINTLKQELQKLVEGVTCCNTQVDGIKSQYHSFFDDFSSQAKAYSDAVQKLKNDTSQLPNEVVNVAQTFLTNFLNELGGYIGSFIRDFEPALDAFDVSWVIGSVNIVRTNILFSLLIGCMYLSVVAHLYVIEMVLFTVLLWYRRRGMGDADLIEINETSSMSFSSQNPQKPQDVIFNPLIESNNA